MQSNDQSILHLPSLPSFLLSYHLRHSQSWCVNIWNQWHWSSRITSNHLRSQSQYLCLRVQSSSFLRLQSCTVFYNDCCQELGTSISICRAILFLPMAVHKNVLVFVLMFSIHTSSKSQSSWAFQSLSLPVSVRVHLQLKLRIKVAKAIIFLPLITSNDDKAGPWSQCGRQTGRGALLLRQLLRLIPRDLGIFSFLGPEIVLW